MVQNPAVWITYSASIDATKSGNTPIFTTGAQFIPVTTYIHLTSVSGLTLVATISVGTNSPTFNNINATSLLTGLVTVNNVFSLIQSAIYPIIPAGTQISCEVSIPATASVYTIQVFVQGLYIS